MPLFCTFAVTRLILYNSVGAHNNDDDNGRGGVMDGKGAVEGKERERVRESEGESTRERERGERERKK